MRGEQRCDSDIHALGAHYSVSTAMLGHSALSKTAKHCRHLFVRRNSGQEHRATTQVVLLSERRAGNLARIEEKILQFSNT